MDQRQYRERNGTIKVRTLSGTKPGKARIEHKRLGCKNIDSKDIFRVLHRVAGKLK